MMVLHVLIFSQQNISTFYRTLNDKILHLLVIFHSGMIFVWTSCNPAAVGFLFLLVYSWYDLLQWISTGRFSLPIILQIYDSVSLVSVWYL